MSVEKSNVFNKPMENLDEFLNTSSIKTYLDGVGIKLDINKFYVKKYDNIICINAVMNDGKICNILEYSLMNNKAGYSLDAFNYSICNVEIRELCYWLCNQLNLEIPTGIFKCVSWSGARQSVNFKCREENI